MKRRLLLHTAFWLAYWLIYSYTYSRYDGQLPKYLLTEGLQMPARMLSTYLSIGVFEYFGKSGRVNYWLAFGGAAAAVVGGGLLNRLLKWWYVVPVFFSDSTIHFWDFRAVYDIFDCLVAACTALSVRMYFRQQELLRREEALRIEKLNAELLALKRQVHPHFLFNTINNLYALARKKSEKTAPVALQLAHLLRYVLYESAKTEVRIEQEVRLLQDYVALEKLRFDEDRLRVEMQVALDQPDQPITPLLLLPFVENAFKHGVSEKRADAWVRIRIMLAGSNLEILVENSNPGNSQEIAEGIGLKNVQRQLELLYPGRHELKIEPGTDLFRVKCVVSLQSSSNT